MAIDFPSSPSNGDTYTFNGRSYQYDSTATAWIRIGTAAIGSDTDAGVFKTATQTEMEAASAVNVVVTPGRQRFHPSAAKMWTRFTWSAGTPTGAASNNVSSYTDTGTGSTTVNLTTNFSSTSWAAISSTAQPNTGNPSIAAGCQDHAAGSVLVVARQSTSNIDFGPVGLVGFGDQ